MDNKLNQDGHMSEEEFLRRLAIARAQLRAGVPVDEHRNAQQEPGQPPQPVAAAAVAVPHDDDEIDEKTNNKSSEDNNK